MTYLATQLEEEIKLANDRDPGSVSAVAFSQRKTRSAAMKADTLREQILPYFRDPEAKRRLVKAWVQDRVPAEFVNEIMVEQKDATVTNPLEKPSWALRKPRLWQLVLEVGRFADLHDEIAAILQNLCNLFAQDDAEKAPALTIFHHHIEQSKVAETPQTAAPTGPKLRSTRGMRNLPPKPE